MHDFRHLTVLREAVADQLLAELESRTGGGPDRPPCFLDGTLGGGGHAEALLERSEPDGRVLGIDRDPAALAAASQRLARFGKRFAAVRGSFGELTRLAAPWAPFDGIVLDLGVSSPQLDVAARGFSFMRDGPLDMRMDPDQPLDAARLLDEISEGELVDILRRYGEEPRARRIARAILSGRPWRSTVALAECVAQASGYHGGRTHPATRTFQALRYAVNDELGELERGLHAALGSLRPGGRLAVITFNSLEDRLVKHRYRDAAGVGAPKDAYGHPVVQPLARLVIPKGISGADADPENPRARSARVRFLEMTTPPR